MNPTTLSKVGFGLAIVALVTCIIAIAIPYWITREETIVGVKTEINDGLWRSCAKVTTIFGKASSCVDIKSPQNWLSATRGMVMFGMFLIFFCIVILAVHFWYMKDVEAFQMIASFLVCTAGLVTLIGALIYGSKYEEYIRRKPFQFHAGFWLTMCTTILCFITAVVLVIGRLF